MSLCHTLLAWSLVITGDYVDLHVLIVYDIYKMIVEHFCNEIGVNLVTVFFLNINQINNSCHWLPP